MGLFLSSISLFLTTGLFISKYVAPFLPAFLIEEESPRERDYLAPQELGVKRHAFHENMYLRKENNTSRQLCSLYHYLLNYSLMGSREESFFPKEIH